MTCVKVFLGFQDLMIFVTVLTFLILGFLLQPGNLEEIQPNALTYQYFLARNQGAAQFRTCYVLLGLVIWAFSFAVFAQAQSSSQEPHNAAIAIIDEDNSPLSHYITEGSIRLHISIGQSSSICVTSIA